MDCLLEPLAEEHRRPVIDLLNFYITNTFATHGDQPVGHEFFDQFLAARQAGYPALALRGPGGGLAGFGLLRPWHPVATLRRSAEIIYFLAPGQTRRGLGGLLLERLSEGARPLGVDSLLATVNSHNQASLDFHASHGFVECGRFVRAGRKWGKDFDAVWMQKFL